MVSTRSARWEETAFSSTHFDSFCTTLHCLWCSTIFFLSFFDFFSLGSLSKEEEGGWATERIAVCYGFANMHVWIFVLHIHWINTCRHNQYHCKQAQFSNAAEILNARAKRIKKNEKKKEYETTTRPVSHIAKLFATHFCICFVVRWHLFSHYSPLSLTWSVRSPIPFVSKWILWTFIELYHANEII